MLSDGPPAPVGGPLASSLAPQVLGNYINAEGEKFGMYVRQSDVAWNCPTTCRSRMPRAGTRWPTTGAPPATGRLERLLLAGGRQRQQQRGPLHEQLDRGEANFQQPGAEPVFPGPHDRRERGWAGCSSVVTNGGSASARSWHGGLPSAETEVLTAPFAPPSGNGTGAARCYIRAVSFDEAGGGS